MANVEDQSRDPQDVTALLIQWRQGDKSSLDALIPMLTPSERTLIVSSRGTPASLAFVDTDSITLLDTVPIAGTGTFGDLAVITDNGRYVYATFDSTAQGTGGVAVVDVKRRRVVDTWMYPGTGRPHGIVYSRRTLHLE